MFDMKDIALHTGAATVAFAVVAAFGLWGFAVANTLFWIERERAQTIDDRPERRPVLDWGLNKNAEWLAPGLLGFLLAAMFGG